MVTKYSGRTGSVKGRTKMVLSMSPSRVTASTSSVKITASFYYESTYRTQDSFNTGKLSGSLGSWTGGFSINGTSKLIKTLTKTVSTSYSGSKKITVTGTLQTIEASPGAHKVSASLTIPKRPVSKPNKPSSVSMSLLSDNRMKTTWSHSTSTARPVTSYTVQYQRLDGSSWTGWKHSATVKGRSYTSNPGANNHTYRRRVRANNAAGSSSWSYSNYVQMQPYAPTGLKARVKASGDDIAVTWGFNNPAESTAFKLQLQRRVNGGSWTTVSSSFGQVKSKPYTSSYTDTSPGNGTNQYRIRILNSGDGGNSVWSESNVVNTIVPPKAPDHLTPDGVVVDFNDEVTFKWQHHDDGDGADQSHYELRYQQVGQTANLVGGSMPLDPSQWGDAPAGLTNTGSSFDTEHGNWTFDTANNSIRVQPEDGEESVLWNANVSAVTEGEKIRITYETRGNWTKVNARLWVYFFDGDMKGITGNSAGVPSTRASEEWTLQEGEATVPAGAEYVVVRPYLSVGNPTSVYAEFRNMYMVHDDWSTVGPEESEVSEYEADAGEFVNGVDYMWQVRTQGNTKEGYGPWSRPAFVTGWTAPVVAINEGTPPNPLTALPVPLAWTYAQDEGVGQIAWEARLYELGSGDVFDSILEEKSAQSVSQSTTFSTVLTDGARYGVSVRARSAKGQWSEWDTTTFDVELLVPAETRIELSYNEATGQMNLHIVADTAVQDETAEVIEITVDRRINGGEWSPIMVDIPFDAETTLVDNIPSLWGVNEYRVTALTAAPSSALFGPWRKTVTPYAANDENRLFLNWGETFDYMATMQGDLSTSGSYDRSKETQKLLGRKKPISLLGDQLSREHSVSGIARYVPDVCDVEPIPDERVELVGSPYFDDARAWNFSKVQAGPDSLVTADAHYRAKRYGYLMDVVDGNTENLVSPSPRSGVPGTEVPGREVEETVARNLWRGSKLSEDRSALSGSRWADNRQTDEGWEITGGDSGTGGYSLVYTTTAYRVPVDSDVPYSWSIPMKNTGDVPFPVNLYSWLGRSTSGSVTKTDQFVLAPGETRVAKLENMITEDADDIRFSLYYNSNADKPVEGAKITLLDGITLVADDVAADPFNGDGAHKQDELVRRNRAVNGALREGETYWAYSLSPADNIAVGRVAEGPVGYARKLTLSGADATSSGGLYYRDMSVTGSAGDVISVGAWVKQTAGTRFRFSITARNGGTAVGNVAGDYIDATGVWQWVTTAGMEMSDSYDYVQVWAVAYLPEDGFEQSMTGITIEDGPDDPAPYFDGDSQDNGMFRYEYQGAPGESASAEYRVADVLRRNLMTAGLDEFGLSGVTGEEQDDHWLRLTSNTTATTYISSPSPYGGDEPRTPVADGLDVLKFRVRVPVGNEPVQVDARLMMYGANTSQVGEITPSASVIIPADGGTRVITATVPDIDGAVGIRALLYVRTAEGSYAAGNIVEVSTPYLGTDSEPFDSHTPDTYNRLYRKAPDGSSIELRTDSQSLYRWTGAAAASESEKYLPAVSEHFDEYTDMLTVVGGESYALEAFVRAPDLTIGSRVNLTSQGALSSDRQLWGSASLKSNGAAWSASGGTVTEGALNVSRAFSIMGSVTPAFGILATKVKASTVRQPDLAGRTFTVGVNVSADGSDEVTPDKTNVRFEYFDSAGDRIQVGGSNFDNHGLSTTGGEGRTVFTVTMPAGTEAFDIGVINQNTSTGMYLDAVTFEAGTTGGTWIDQDGVEERFGVENIDAADLMVESFDADGASLAVDTVGTLDRDEFSSRWRTITGEYDAPAEAVTARVWVEWNVNGENPANQSDWYVGGMSAVQVYSVPDRWPGPDANPDEWREAQYESTTVCLRTPYGVRVFGAMSGLEVSPVDDSLEMSQVSFTVTETDYTENPLVVDESDIWDGLVLDPQEGMVLGTQSDDEADGTPPFVLTPYSAGDDS